MSKILLMRGQKPNPRAAFCLFLLAACGGAPQTIPTRSLNNTPASGCVRASAVDTDSAVLGRLVELYDVAGTDADVDQAIMNLREQNDLSEDEFWSAVERQGHERSSYRADVARAIGKLRLALRFSIDEATFEEAYARYSVVSTTESSGECVESWPLIRLRELPLIGNELVSSEEIHATLNATLLDSPTELLPFGPRDQELVYAIRRIYSDRGRLKATANFRFMDGQEVPTVVIVEGAEYRVGAVRFSIPETLSEVADRIRASCPAVVGEVVAFAEIRAWRDTLPQVAETIGVQVEAELRPTTDDENHTVDIELVVRPLEESAASAAPAD